MSGPRDDIDILAVNDTTEPCRCPSCQPWLVRGVKPRGSALPPLGWSDLGLFVVAVAIVVISIMLAGCAGAGEWRIREDGSICRAVRRSMGGPITMECRKLSKARGV